MKQSRKLHGNITGQLTEKRDQAWLATDERLLMHRCTFGTGTHREVVKEWLASYLIGKR
ncbi:hypothetical protein [Aporhodopirellula aestuarii]|uniref:Uncharacterized protein n=1 Tax=Aporhodopirellula aestuarii TaxID=2950107 RepID=A0ABT0U2W3_9BACT|nr:hypothetical protein [Aporhodopirellula aestuarii]MCM2371233.1 hypothetical protein [Aporhodopirellula aestuarii]